MNNINYIILDKEINPGYANLLSNEIYFYFTKNIKIDDVIAPTFVINGFYFSDIFQ